MGESLVLPPQLVHIPKTLGALSLASSASAYLHILQKSTLVRVLETNSGIEMRTNRLPREHGHDVGRTYERKVPTAVLGGLRPENQKEKE